MKRVKLFILIMGMVLTTACVCTAVLADSSDASDSSEKPEALRIILDPGHGGRDSGALGPNGVREKDITLAVCKELAARLREKGFDVFITRNDDSFIPLVERTAFANKNKGDLFVSIHVNANEDKLMRGVETYFLNLAADASSLKVAERENASGAKPKNDLQFIIEDLLLNGKINESSMFASSVQKSIVTSFGGSGYRCRNNGVKQAFFIVLEGAQMPSILIETGFITNTAECKLLQEKVYQSILVNGIITGINVYTEKTSLGKAEKNSTKREQKHTSLTSSKDL